MLQNLAIVVDDPLPPCGRPDQVKPTSSSIGPDRPSSIIAPNRRTTISAKTKMSTSAGSRSAGPSGSICRPSSVAPRTGNHEKEIGDSAAADLTIGIVRPAAAAPARPIEQVEQIRWHRAAQPRARV